MFKSKIKEKISNKAEKSKQGYSIKYKKPKILFIDFLDAAYGYAKSKGYNVYLGTFGSPFKVTKGSGYLPIICNSKLPNYTEQEIIFIDLMPPEALESPEGHEPISTGEKKFWGKTNTGIIDPRSSIMFMVSKDFDRILWYGGLFVIFAQSRGRNVYWGRETYDKSVSIDTNVHIDNWSFLSVFSPENFDIKSDNGTEIIPVDFDHPLPHFLRRNLDGASFEATFKPDYGIKENWIPLLKNKYDEVVGGLYAPENSRGRILVLPQLSVSVKVKRVIELLNNVLPEISPHLFPHIEGSRWVEREEYELEPVLNYKKEKNEVKKRVENELVALDEKIKKEREELGFLHEILTQSGDALVKSVEKCLRFIGFKNVVNVDEEIQGKKSKTGLQEDLQVKDKPPILLIEVKGMLGLPSEGDVIQVHKYVTRRMKEWKDTNIRGVSIINHHRKIPTLERDNKNVFTNEQIGDVENNDITVLTTWDLFLLVRGMIKWNWNPKVIQKLLYIKGKMSRIPENYTYLGEIVHYWEKINVVGIEIHEDKLSKGDRIGYIIPDGYLEEEVSSIQVEHEDVNEAASGQAVGIETKYGKGLLKKGTVVCKINKNE